MKSPKEKGDLAEDIAVKYLENKGYIIIARNWYHHHHELDVIARKENMLVVIEIKSLINNYFREPYNAVTVKKQQMIISAANAFILKNNIIEEVRFDVISITYNSNKPEVYHLENAFYPHVK